MKIRRNHLTHKILPSQARTPKMEKNKNKIQTRRKITRNIQSFKEKIEKRTGLEISVDKS